MHLYRRKTIIALIIIMLIFFLIFIWAFYNLLNGKSVMDIGLSYYTEDYLVMFFSLISIIKAFIEVIKVEHKVGYERRIKKGLSL